MKMTDETKAKIKYSIAISTEVMKLTLQTLTAMPAFHYAYMGLKSLGWVDYVVTATNFYEAAAYLLVLLWVLIVVLAVGIVVITIKVLTSTGKE